MANLTLSLLKCGLTAPKIADIGNFWYKFAEKGCLFCLFVTLWNDEVCDNGNAMKRCNFQNNCDVIA